LWSSVYAVAADYCDDMPMILAIIGGEPQRFTPFVELYHRAFEKLGRATQVIEAHSSGYLERCPLTLGRWHDFADIADIADISRR
jgi:hypothetical protein